MTDKKETTGFLRQKLTAITEALQEAIQTIDRYSEEQQTAERNRNELEESKKKILFLQRRLAKTERLSKRHLSEKDFLQRSGETLRREIEVVNQFRKDKKESTQVSDETKTTNERQTLTGNNKTHNNLDVAELSDENRPTKLAERFAEIFDNEWIDAFQQISEYHNSEKDTIECLLQILQGIMNVCKKESKKQFTKIQEATTLNDTIPGEIPDDEKKNIKDFCRSVADYSGRQIYKVSDTPVVFGPDISSGCKFDEEMYRPYTQTGDEVDFVVWPILLLHENGSVLCKGVAKAYRSTQLPKSLEQAVSKQTYLPKEIQQNDEASASPGCNDEKQDSYSPTTKKSHSSNKPAQEKHSQHDINIFLRWRKLFGIQSTREMLGADRYDQTRSYCLHEGLI